jgi:hypothetical protein
MEPEGGCPSRNFRRNITTPPTLRRVTPVLAERRCNVPRLGDIWIPKSTPSANHFLGFYIPGVEDLFQVGDRIVRVEHSGTRSHFVSWRVWLDSSSKWQFQLESTDEQCFSIFPSDFEPLTPVAEGAQYEFDR